VRAAGTELTGGGGASGFAASGTASETAMVVGLEVSGTLDVLPCRRLARPLLVRLLIAFRAMLARNCPRLRGSRGAKERPCRSVQ